MERCGSESLFVIQIGYWRVRWKFIQHRIGGTMQITFAHGSRPSELSDSSWVFPSTAMAERARKAKRLEHLQNGWQPKLSYLCECSMNVSPRQTPNDESVAISPERKKQRADAIAALILLEVFMEASRYHQAVAGQTIDAEPNGGESPGA